MTSVSVRLTPKQASAIWSGLDVLIKGFNARQAKKQPQFGHPFQIVPAPYGFDLGQYSPEVMKQVRQLWATLRQKPRGGRVWLSAVDIRIAIASARVTAAASRWWRNRARKGKWEIQTSKRWATDPESIARIARLCKRTIHSLERHMKRADRTLRAQVQRPEYEELFYRWKRHLRWMRIHLAYMKPAPPIIQGRRVHLQKALDVLVDICTGGLRDAGYQPPNDRELRRLMRLYVRYCRRGRVGEGNTHSELLANPKSWYSRRYLGRFVLRRLKLERIQP